MQVNSQKREDIRLSILALLLAHKKGCTLQQLSDEYYELEGEHIPWRDLGYHSLLGLLNSMSKVVQIKRENNSIIVKGIASEKSKHVTKLITEQKNVNQSCQRKKYKPSHYYPTTAPPKIHIPAEILTKIISLVSKYPDGVDKNYVLREVQKLVPFLNISKKDIEVQLYELSHQIFQRNGKIYPVQSKPNNADDFKGFDVSSSTKFVSKEQQKSPTVVVAGNENFDDTLDCSEENDFEPLNCSSQFLSSNSNTKIELPSNFEKEVASESQNQMLDQTCRAQIKQRASRNILEAEFHTNVKENNGNCLGNENVEMLINDRIKFRLKKLIENHPDGIWCADLPEKYLEEYKVPLNYIELGFNSVREFASQLPEIFNCIQPYDTGDFRLYDVHSEMSLKKIKEKQEAMHLSELYHNHHTKEQEEALPSVVSLDTCKGLIPDEVMTIGECVGYLNVAALAESKEPYVEVVVVEVFTPSFFWIQYRNKERMFKKFMDDLHNFYSSNYHQYAIPPIVLEKGLNCACVYNGIWHRGIIKTVKPDMQVVVMFYDYGTLKTYAAKAVYYLHKIFAYLPAQAIPCGLINVRPNEGCKWSPSATHNFALKTSQIPLVATVASINTEDNSMMVSLTDTLGAEDVHINDWLVEQKLAKYGKMEDKVDMSNLLLYVEENLLVWSGQCYAEEDCESNKNNKKSFDNVTNIPLVLPRGTLQNTMSMPARETILPNKFENLIKEGNTEEEVVSNTSECTAFMSPKHNTNPFLEDESVNDEVKNIISPQKLLQLWYQNFQLQLQITERFNMLTNAMMNNSAEGFAYNLRDNQDILNMIKDPFHFNNQIPFDINSTKANSANTCASSVSSSTNIYNSTNTNSRNGTLNAGYSVEYPTFAFVNQQPLTTTSNSTNYGCINGKNYNVNICTERVQSISEQYPFRKMPPGNSAFVMETDNDFNTPTQWSGTQEIVREPPTLPEFKRCSNNVTLDQHNFTNYMNTDIPLSADNSICDMATKETNPFRLSLADKLHIPNTQGDNTLHTDFVSGLSKPCDSVIDHNLISFENDRSKINYLDFNHSNHDTYTTFGQCQSVFTDSSSNANTVERTSVSLNEELPSFNSNVSNVANTMSKITISDQPIEHNVHDKSNSGLSPLWKSFLDHDAKFNDGTRKNEQTDAIVTSKYNPFSSVQNNGTVA